MRKASLIVSSVVVAFLCAGIATAAGPDAMVRSGNVEMTVGGGIAPKALSKTAPTPITLWLWGGIRSIDGSPPSSMTEFVFDTDANSAIDVRGLPTCSGGSRGIRELRPIKGCGNAIVGEGSAGFDLYFAETLVPAKSRLIVYNAGIKAGVTTLFAYAYFAQPTTTTLVMPIRIERIQDGRLTSRATVTVPKIIGGAGILSSFDVKIGKTFARKGKRVSVLTAKCPSGKLHARVEANFVDGTNVRSRLASNCVARD